MLGLIQQPYAVEKTAEAMTDAQRADLRQGATQPELDQIKLWLEAQHPQVLPRSPIGDHLRP